MLRLLRSILCLCGNLPGSMAILLLMQEPILWPFYFDLALYIPSLGFLGGDFSEVLSHKEKTGINQCSKAQIIVFRDTLLDYGLQGLRFERNPFTWSNNRDDAHLFHKRLDRFVASQSWISLFPSMVTYNLSSAASDHVQSMISNFASQNKKSRHRRRQNIDQGILSHFGCISRDPWMLLTNYGNLLAPLRVLKFGIA